MWTTGLEDVCDQRGSRVCKRRNRANSQSVIHLLLAMLKPQISMYHLHHGCFCRQCRDGLKCLRRPVIVPCEREKGSKILPLTSKPSSRFPIYKRDNERPLWSALSNFATTTWIFFLWRSAWVNVKLRAGLEVSYRLVLRRSPTGAMISHSVQQHSLLLAWHQWCDRTCRLSYPAKYTHLDYNLLMLETDCSAPKEYVSILYRIEGTIEQD